MGGHSVQGWSMTLIVSSRWWLVEILKLNFYWNIEAELWTLKLTFGRNIKWQDQWKNCLRPYWVLPPCLVLTWPLVLTDIHVQKNTKEYDHQQRIIEAQLSAPFLLGGNMTIGHGEQKKWKKVQLTRSSKMNVAPVLNILHKSTDHLDLDHWVQ